MLLSTVECQNFCVFERKYWRSKSILPYRKKIGTEHSKGRQDPEVAYSIMYAAVGAKKLASQEQAVAFDENFIATPQQLT